MMELSRSNWIKDLVKAEEQLEETGVVDLSLGLDGQKVLAQEALTLLGKLKEEFIEAANAFNDLKASPLGRIKIYGIAKTQADFMLFRNGFKMIFYFKAPGVIAIRHHFLGTAFNPPAANVAAVGGIPTSAMGAMPAIEETLIEARRGPFHDLIWSYQGEPVRMEALVKYHFTLFVKESSK